jgi:hypothetical protein
MTALSLDPGKRTGWAEWSDEGVLLDHGILFIEEVPPFLNWKRPSRFIVEDYVLDHRAGKQKGSKLEAVQVIGMVKQRAHQINAVIYLQKQESRDMGYVHAGIKKATRHDDSHDLDAVAHGFWHWEAQRLVPDISSLYAGPC